jgi:mRNA turnover protein 4
MPKSKRSQRITISKSSKKLKANRGLELKQELVKKIRSRLDDCSNLFVIRLYNERTDKLQIVRSHFPPSESSYFFFGKNRVMQLALGRTAATEYLPSLSKISPYLVGKMGLMLTNRSPQEILEYFNKLEMEDYARAGNRVKETVIIDEGSLDGFQHTMEPLLRSLGLTTTLKKGIIHLLKPFTICSKGDLLTPEQAKLLKLFQRPLAQFKIKVKAHWNKNNQQVQVFDLHEEQEEEDDDNDQEQAEDNHEEMIEQDDEN